MRDFVLALNLAWYRAGRQRGEGRVRGLFHCCHGKIDAHLTNRLLEIDAAIY
jgi:hypothetical protein